MITLAISSMKGGVGKTTSAINLAYSCAKRGWKTLLVDGDPQGSINMSLSPTEKSYNGLYEVLVSSLPLESAVLKTKLDNLQIVMTGKIPVQEISKWCSSLQDGSRLKPFFESVRNAGYDLVIVDTPSGLHGPTEGFLRNATHVLVPQQCEPLALRSLMMTLDFLDQLITENPEACSLVGVVLTMSDANVEESRQVVEEIRRILPPELIFQANFQRDSEITNASMRAMPLGLLRGDAPKPIGLHFDALAAELEAKLGLQKPEPSDEHVPLVV